VLDVGVEDTLQLRRRPASRWIDCKVWSVGRATSATNPLPCAMLNLYRLSLPIPAHFILYSDGFHQRAEEAVREHDR